jgi:hypothetical protein
MTIRLPKDPKDYDYEDQVAAMLLACGYYLETRLVLKAGTEEVLEFDALATPVNDYANRKVVEVKSGGWGIGDIFKLYGQTLYTGHGSAWLIHKQASSDTKKEAIAEVCEKIPVKTLRIDPAAGEQGDDFPLAIEMEKKLRNVLMAAAWWSRIADRLAQAKFRQWAKSDNTGADIVQKSRRYAGQLESSLFKESPLRRADAIYDAYKAAPQLTSSLIQHVLQHSGDPLHKVRKSVWDTHERVYVQYIAALEHRARIAVIKNAYDAVLLEKATPNPAVPWLKAGLGYKAFLPTSFQAGMQSLEAHPHAHRVAYFLQVFIEVLGGFYFSEDPEDVKLVADATGLPTEIVPEMVGMLDSFFPLPNGWVHKGQGGFHFIKGVPAYLRGAGCFAREFTRGKDWCKKNNSSWWTVNWHNALYNLLQPIHAVDQGAA